MKTTAPTEPTGHAELNQLLPWYVNGTLEADEQRRVAAHLRTCLTCRREVGLLSALQHRIRQTSLPDMHTRINLNRFWSRLDTPPEPRWQRILHCLIPRRPVILRQPAWSFALLLILVLPVLAITATWLASPQQAPSHSSLDPAPYRTLASPTLLGPGDVRVIFATSVEHAQLARMLREFPARVRILEGRPMIHHHSVYLLRVEPDTALDQILSRLRQMPGVVFAEPVVPTSHTAGDPS